MKKHKAEERIKNLHKEMNRILNRTIEGVASFEEIVTYDKLLEREKKLLKELKDRSR